MKEFFQALKYCTLLQILCWIVFIALDENRFINQSNAELLALFGGIGLLLAIIILYFLKSNKIIKKHQLSSIKFNISLALIWNILSIFISIFLLVLIDKGLLHICRGDSWACFLNGIEYVLYPILMIVVVILVVIIKKIIKIYKYFKKA